MREVPEELTSGPFSRSRAIELGVTSRMLEGKRFVRIHPCVYRIAAYVMTDADWVEAARLALPDDAHLTGISLIQELGLDFGPRRPVRFVVARDLHLTIDGIFLHRTRQLPPHGPGGVCVEAAFIAFCARARVIDAIKVGDWLLHFGHMVLKTMIELAGAHLWRDGAYEALWVSNHLNARSKSLKESELRAILVFAGLPIPQVNVDIDLGAVVVEADLVFDEYATVVEYEGVQHQEDRQQYTADLDRYGLYRDAGRHYVQIAKEHLASPKVAVTKVHRQLVKGGYDGPPPVFGELWRELFARVSTVVGPKHIPTEVA